MKTFEIRRPLKKNILRILFFAAAEAAAAVGFKVLYNPEPVTMNEKTLAAVIFCVLMIFSLLSLGYIADSLRNIFGKAAVILTDETLWISKCEKEIQLKDITEMSIEKRKKAVLVISCGEFSAEIRDGLCELPLFTVKDAIQNRIDDLSNKTGGLSA